jgi:hypothetical protein
MLFYLEAFNVTIGIDLKLSALGSYIGGALRACAPAFSFRLPGFLSQVRFGHLLPTREYHMDRGWPARLHAFHDLRLSA